MNLDHRSACERGKPESEFPFSPCHVTMSPCVSGFKIFLVESNVSFSAYPKERQCISKVEKKLALLDSLRDDEILDRCFGSLSKVIFIRCDFCLRCSLIYSFKI